MRFLPGRFRRCAYEKDVMGALWTVMMLVSVADICSHRRRCCSLCSMDKDAIMPYYLWIRDARILTELP